MSRRWTRRRVILGTGALAAATGAGIATQTQTASADVSGQYRIPDATQTLAGESLQDVRLAVDATYSFSANAKITGVELELHVGGGMDTLDLIARTTRDDLGTNSLTGEQTLAGSLMSASDFDIQDFRPGSGRVEQTVTSALRLYVKREGEVVADAKHTTTFTVTVADGELQVEATLGGTGEVQFQTG